MPHLEPLAARPLAGSPQAFAESSARAITAARAHVASLKAGASGRADRAVLADYDDAMAALSNASALASLAKNAHPDPAMRQTAERCEAELEAVTTELSLDPEIFAALEALELDGEDAVTRRFLSHALRDLRRAGVDRDAATRQRIKALNEALVRTGQDFGRNIREDVRFVDLAPAALDGLPEDYVRGHPVRPDGTVRITTEYPDLIPFMTYARSAQAREALWRVNRQRGHPANAAVLDGLLATRHALATLLGFPHWAAYVTADKMTGSAERAAEFIEKIAAASADRCQRDHQQLLDFKRRRDPGAARVDPWELAYLEDQLRADAAQLDSQALRPYFEFGRVQQGVLDITARLFGIRYVPVHDAPVWHPDVQVFDVCQGDTRLGRIFLDLHPRDGKYAHAAQFTVCSGQRDRLLPEGALLCNFPRPGAEQPSKNRRRFGAAPPPSAASEEPSAASSAESGFSTVVEPALMLHRDVVTFFHEFGHLLHHVLGGHTEWASQSGVRTEWDFVEAPSQLLEEWAWHPESLRSFARHLHTGEALPADTISRMRAAEGLGKGIQVRQQMFYAALSLQLHQRDPTGLDVAALAAELQSRYTPFPHVPDTYFHLAFGHLDGYSAIYYTYMWSLVLAKDLFTAFEDAGPFSAETASRYRRAVLEPGGSADAAQLVEAFLGRPSSFVAYQRWLDAR